MQRADLRQDSWRAWWPSAVMMACSLLSYVDRQILAILSPLILKETGMTAELYATVVSSFSVSYMIGNPLWGAVLDRIGLRYGMILAVALWSAASGAHAVMYGYLGFIAARAVLGFGEGATFPGGLRTAMDSLPPEKRSRGVALAYSGGSLGAMLTPIVVTPIAIAFGWRTAFWVTAVAGALWIIVWAATVRVPASQQSKRFLLPSLLERRFWMLVSSYALGALPLAPILYLAPLYLARVHAFSQADLGKVLWIPPLGWEVGYFFWGWFADRYAAENPRPAWLLWSLAFLGLPLACITLLETPAPVLALMFWAMFIAGGFVVVSLRTGALWYPREQTASVAGIGAGSWSALVALALPPLGRLFDGNRYTEAFVFVAFAPLLGIVVWSLLTPARGARERELLP